jgi:hypothetical protein
MVRDATERFRQGNPESALINERAKLSDGDRVAADVVLG